MDPRPPTECCRKCIVRRVGASYKASGPDASGMYDASYSVVQGVGARRVGDVRRVGRCRGPTRRKIPISTVVPPPPKDSTCSHAHRRAGEAGHTSSSSHAGRCRRGLRLRGTRRLTRTASVGRPLSPWRAPTVVSMSQPSTTDGLCRSPAKSAAKATSVSPGRRPSAPSCAAAPSGMTSATSTSPRPAPCPSCGGAWGGLSWVGSKPHPHLRDHGHRPSLRVTTPAGSRLSGLKAYRTDDRMGGGGGALGYSSRSELGLMDQRIRLFR